MAFEDDEIVRVIRAAIHRMKKVRELQTRDAIQQCLLEPAGLNHYVEKDRDKAVVWSFCNLPMQDRERLLDQAPGVEEA